MSINFEHGLFTLRLIHKEEINTKVFMVLNNCVKKKTLIVLSVAKTAFLN